MRSSRWIVLAALLWAAPAGAQQQSPATPIEQAFGAKFMEEIGQNIHLRAEMIALQAKLAETEIKLKAAEDAKKKATEATSPTPEK